jgi:hypothetical protein
MQIPIACTLTSESAAARIEEWRHFFAHSTGAAEKAGDLQLRVHLDGSPRTLEAAVDLARREKACCDFFEFAIEVEADASWLSIRVPPDGAATLEDFVSLLPTPPY